MNSLKPIEDSDHVLVRPASRTGLILKKNEKYVTGGGTLEILSESCPHYAVPGNITCNLAYYVCYSHKNASREHGAQDSGHVQHGHYQQSAQD